MPRSTQKLDELANLLERTGNDPKRLDAVRATQGFRRSWLDLAKSLCEIRKRGDYERWGFGNFHEYCEKELTLKRATVDKLTISYSTIQRHAPQVLKRDGVAKTIPSYDAIDYYQKTVGWAEKDTPANDRPKGKVPKALSEEKREEFVAAVFEEGKPVAELRKRFDADFFPKAKGQTKLETLRKANAAAHKLATLLADIDDLPAKFSRKLVSELGELRASLDDLSEPIKEQVTKAKARANKRALRTHGIEETKAPETVTAAK